MAQKIAFQFDDKLQYQLDAVSSVVRLFEGLPQKVGGIYERATRVQKLMEGDPVRNIEITAGTRLLDNLRAVQLDNNLYADSEVLPGNNFTVEMETGTGKTYVYLRTILELHKEYGFKKFMIVVPSVAIRIGVEKSIEMLAGHFKAIYDIDLSKHSFVYDSGNPRKVSSSFVEANDLAICVMNIQAFNKDSNKIRSEDEYGQILWEDIKYIRPIVIIDEPQKIEGGKKNKSKSLQAIEAVSPLFMVVYGALYGEGGTWVRPLSMWENPIEVDGTTVKRFEYIGENSDSDRQHDLQEALRAINSTIGKCEKAQLKLREGTPQHTLTKRRLEAFYIAVQLIENEMERGS